MESWERQELEHLKARYQELERQYGELIARHGGLIARVSDFIRTCGGDVSLLGRLVTGLNPQSEDGESRQCPQEATTRNGVLQSDAAPPQE